MWGSEAQLATAVVEWLKVQGWDVYPEVSMRGGDARADIVAVRSSLLWVIECKRTFGLAVIAQADTWLPYSNLTSVAVPIARNSDARRFGEELCKDRGIGIIHPQHDLPREWYTRWGRVAPKLRRHCDSRLRDMLSESHKKYVPGNADCRYHTPWRETCERVRTFVHAKGPATIREVVEAITHHYDNDRNAIGSLRQWAQAGKIPGVGVDTSVRPFRFVPVPGAFPR